MGTGKSTTGGQHSFARIPQANIQRSKFDRSCGLKTTMYTGVLTPIFTDEALPGDTMSLDATLFGRLATPLHPFMDNMYLDTHFFAVPIRLIWDNFQKFMGEQVDPGDSTDYLIPTLTTPGGGHLAESLADYFGIPTEVENLDPSALWHRAYNLIWNEWFRDENLQDSVVVDRDDGPDDESDYEILYRGKRHDYFTSCLPFPQKGPSVELPLGTSAPVIGTGDLIPEFNLGGGAPGNPTNLQSGVSAGDASWVGGGLPALTDAYWEDPKLEADLTNATAATINEIRQAFQIQRLYERDARGGTRYTEVLRSHFGVTSPDQRLQRPEYLGGSSTPMNINSVPQTAPGTVAQTDLGEVGAYGVVATRGGHGFNKSFTEHCVIIGLASIRADLNYQQGLNRQWSRSTRWDFYWPTLAHLGEQSVLNKEIYAQGDANDELVFGYQERFAEYRYKPSIITGAMRSNYTDTLDSWHLAQDFGSLPTLGEDFILEDPPIGRVLAVPTAQQIILDGFFNYKCARPMPMFGVPGNIDRF